MDSNNPEKKSQQDELSTTLKALFPTPQEENKVHAAKQILGDLITDLPDSILETFITELEYLAVSWLDDYEQSVFEGRTLEQLLKGETV